MSKSLNRHDIIGHLGTEVEVRELTNGNVANFTVATNQSWKDKASGEKQERTDWHRIVLYGNLANIARDHLNKGDRIYLSGRVQTRKWEDKEGVERYTTETVCSDLIMLDGGIKDERREPNQQREAD